MSAKQDPSEPTHLSHERDLVSLPDGSAQGCIHTINNIVNMTVVSRDASDFKAEYNAGVVQGVLQGNAVLSARDNTWDNAYLTDPKHQFPAQPGPTSDELWLTRDLLNDNYSYLLQYLRAPSTNATVALRLKRLLFRMLGIYHGVATGQPATLDFSGSWLPDQDYFKPAELELGYGPAAKLSFLDVYLINAYNDLSDVIASTTEDCKNGERHDGFPDKCSAFIKRISDHEVILTHNTWSGFLSQTMAQTIVVNNDWFSVNAGSPGLIGSGTDFGFNNKGIVFNETTHRMSQLKTKVAGLWSFWRATLAEQFASSIQEFFDLMSLDNTGTYLNGYMLVDAKTTPVETGLIEMSYRCFVYYISRGGEYTVTGKALDGNACWTKYDPEMVTRSYLMGINYPASIQVRTDLESDDNRPARREQLRELLHEVHNVESAERVITHTDPRNPLSIFGRWDLAYGTTPSPKQVPDGSVDAKVATVEMARAFMKLRGEFDPTSPAKGFYMLYGTPKVNGEPFIWSQSSWSWQQRRDVPDVLDGVFTHLPLYLK